MRRLFALLPILILLSGCNPAAREITQKEIVQAYTEAGYTVWAGEYDEPLEYGQTGYIQADHPDGDYIYFTFFQTSEQANAFHREFYHPVLLGMFLTLLSGELHVPYEEVYGNIVIQYGNPEYYEIFADLLKNK